MADGRDADQRAAKLGGPGHRPRRRQGWLQIRVRSQPLREKKAHADSVLAEASRATKFRIVGHTVDIQALTLFMKTLEASPFIQNVQLTRSDIVLVENKEVTEFQLEAETQKPPAFLVKTVAMTVGEN